MKRKRELKRPLIQLLAAALFNGYALGFAKGKIFTGGTKAFCVPVLNCYSCPGALGACPVGALQAILGGGAGRFSFYVLGLIMLFGVVLGRLICGFLCPFGFVQDLLHKIPVPKLRVAPRVDKPLRWLKYLVGIVLVVALPMVVAGAAGLASPYFCKWLCPAGTLGGAIPLMLMNEGLRASVGFLFNWKMAILIAVVAASMFIYRPFCKYLCPLGAFYGLFNKFAFFQMHLDKDKCINCKKCEKVCKMQVPVTENINHSECIRCGDCKRVCPTAAISSGMEIKIKKAQSK